MTRWLVVTTLLACSTPKPPPKPPPPVSQCARVSDHLVSLMSGAGKFPPEASDPLRRVIEERCDQDAWSADAKQCLLQTESLADGDRCQAMMTPAQVEAFQRAGEAAIAELRSGFQEDPQSAPQPIE